MSTPRLCAHVMHKDGAWRIRFTGLSPRFYPQFIVDALANITWPINRPQDIIPTAKSAVSTYLDLDVDKGECELNFIVYLPNEIGMAISMDSQDDFGRHLMKVIKLQDRIKELEAQLRYERLAFFEERDRLVGELQKAKRIPDLG